MAQIQFFNVTPEQLQNAIIEGVNSQLKDFKKHLQPKEPTKFVTRNYVAKEMLHCNLSTVHNLTKKGVLVKYQIGGKVLYRRDEVENAIIKLKK